MAGHSEFARYDTLESKQEYKYRIYHVYEEYKRTARQFTRGVAEGKPSSGVYRVYTPIRRGISDLYYRRPIAACHLSSL